MMHVRDILSKGEGGMSCIHQSTMVHVGERGG